MTTRTLYDWFRRAAEANPDDIALEVLDHRLSYSALRAAADWMAVRIRDAAGGTPTRVGLLTSRSLVAYVGYLGILRLGATAVPLNPAAPATRNLDIADQADLEVTIIDDTSGDGAAEYGRKTDSAVLGLTGDLWRPLLDPGTTAPPDRIPARGASDVAYVLFTSGTTGKPKGVPITHGNLDSFLTDIIPRYGLGPGCRVSQTFEISFDGSVIELFSAWGSGATLCIAQHSDVFTPVRFVNEKRLTHWMSVPSLVSFAKRLRALAPGSMPSLRRSQFGGEPLTIEQAEAWSAAAPNAVVHNCYGPTEATVIVTGYAVPRSRSDWLETSNRSVPIGIPYAHMDWLLLDGDLRSGSDGELCVRGPQLFPGYLDPAENVGRFVSFDGTQGYVYDGTEPLTEQHYYRTGDRCRIEYGELVHLGRVDEQIKIRGYRVELGEIESVLRQHPAVAEVVVLPIYVQDGEIDLHAVYTGADSGAEFASLLESLPWYMHPRGFHHRDSIPLTTIGKIDRKRLIDELLPIL